MEIYSEILDSLQKEYDAGATYQQIAKKHNVSYQYARALMQGERPPKRISLEYLFKLFPKTTINIHGDNVNAENSGINNGVMGINHGTVNAAGYANSLEHFRHKIQDEIIQSDVEPEAKVKILNIILNTKP